MAETKLAPWQHNVRIVNPDGTPDPYFIQWFNQLLEEKGLLDAQAEQTAGVDVIAGTGLSLVSGGPVIGPDDIEIQLDAVIDDLNDVDTSTTPPTNGQALIWDNAASLWKPGSASGGSVAWTIVGEWDFAIDGAVANLDSDDLSSYTEALIVFMNVTLSAAGWRIARVSVDGGANYISTANYRSLNDTGTIAASDTAYFSHSTSSTAARSGIIYIHSLDLPVKPATTTRLSNSATCIFDGDANPVNRIRAQASTGNMNGGKVWILAR